MYCWMGGWVDRWMDGAEATKIKNQLGVHTTTSSWGDNMKCPSNLTCLQDICLLVPQENA